MGSMWSHGMVNVAVILWVLSIVLLVVYGFVHGENDEPIEKWDNGLTNS